MMIECNFAAVKTCCIGVTQGFHGILSTLRQGGGGFHPRLGHTKPVIGVPIVYLPGAQHLGLDLNCTTHLDEGTTAENQLLILQD